MNQSPTIPSSKQSTEGHFRVAFSHPVIAPLFVVVVGLISHFTCLHAIFYFDDWYQIVQSQSVLGGHWIEQELRALPYLTFWLNYKFFGLSSLAFHATNLAVHLVTGLSVLYCADTFLRLGSVLAESGKSSRGPSRFAFLAALIFVTHPLTVEITHYTRARDHELVGLFAFLAAFGVLRFLKGRPIWIFFLMPVVFLAVISKEAGLPHAMLGMLLVAIFGLQKADWHRVISNRLSIICGVVLCILGVVFYTSLLEPLVGTLLRQTNDNRLVWHILTQARVFWSYLQLMVFPSGLSADHLVAWTRSTQDVIAWICLGGVLVAVIATLLLWRRGYRVIALFFALVSGHLLLRNLYVVSELMVEYRTYPSMLWFAMLAALIIGMLAGRRPRLYVACAVIVVSMLMVLSIRRGRDWQSIERLAHSTLQVDALQLRALIEMNREDLREKKWQSIIDRQPEFQRLFAMVMDLNKKNPLRYYENWTLWAVQNECQLSEAILNQKGPLAARMALHATAKRMLANRMNNILFW